MKFFLINLFVMMMAIMSVQAPAQADTSFLTEEGADALSSLPIWDMNSVSPTSSKKESTVVSIIAQAFFPIVIIANLAYELPSYRHYLPIYSFKKAKEYFLLI